MLIMVNPSQNQLIATLGKLLKDGKFSSGSENFANSLIYGFNRYGALTTKQYDAALRMIQRETSPKEKVDGESIKRFQRLFDIAKAQGLKRIVIRMEGLQVSPAPDNGRNAGYLYAKNATKEYLGKISPSGEWQPANSISTDTARMALEAFTAFGRDPVEAARAYGQRTGTCCFCGLALTDGRSVVVGYGPICADKFGLPWGEEKIETHVEVALPPEPKKRGRPRKNKG